MTDIAHFPRPGQNYPYVLLYHQPALKWPRLIINSSLPIGCQFIWETKLTLKSHKMILEKSWWNFLVVVVAIVIVIFIVIVVVIAVVIALVIAVVIVKV